MTRIRLDPAAMRGAAGTLEDAGQTVSEARARLRPQDVTGLPPAIAAHVRHELATTSSMLTASSQRIHVEAHMLRVRASLAEVADGAGSAWSNYIDRAGAVGPLAAMYSVWRTGRSALGTAARFYLNPVYATRHGVRTAWQRTAEQSVGRRLTAMRSYASRAGWGLRGATTRWHGIGATGSAITKGARLIERSATKKIPIVGDALTWGDTYHSEIRAGSTTSQAQGAAAGATAGSRGGALAGAATGAAIGAFGGPVGAIAGGVVGGVAGSLGGTSVGRRIGRWFGGH